MNVYGISGLKGHGKDSLAKAIQGESGDFRITHFAFELKRLGGVIFGLTDAQMHDQLLKELPLPEPVHMDEFLPAMREQTGLDIQPAEKVANTPREVLQYLGTEYVRRARQSYWVDCVLKEIMDVGDFFLVPDTRYPNEADALRSIGGKVIKVKRIDIPEHTDGHSSETEMAKIDPDLLLGTVTGGFGLQSKVAALIARGQFEEAKKYDYRRIERALAEFRAGGTTRDVAHTLELHLVDAEFVLDYYKINCKRCLGYRRFIDGELDRGQVGFEIMSCQDCKVIDPRLS